LEIEAIKLAAFLSDGEVTTTLSEHRFELNPARNRV
jgi:hypothetical protein